MRKYWKEYDVTIYMEEDVIVEYGHLVGYLSELHKLQLLIGKQEALEQYYVGFQRYRRHLVPMEKNKVKMSEEDLLHQEFLEEIPYFKPVCIKNIPYLHVMGNKRTPPASVYQAMWILTQDQIQVLQNKCGYVDQTLRSTQTK